jgi:SAM-dependent methyltransferase
MTEPNPDPRTSQKTSLPESVIKGAMRLFFRLLYHPFAWSYDLVASAVSVGRWRDWVLASAGLLQGPQILELGFGPGHLQNYLHKNGTLAFGLDESWQMARQAKSRLSKNGHKARLVRGIAQHLPYPNAAFDTVTATFPTLYIVDPKTLEAIWRVLIPGGRLVVLMTAWIIGDSLRERAARALNHVTAETPPDDMDLGVYLEPYQQAGFQASLRFVEQGGSRLMFIIAKKESVIE